MKLNERDKSILEYVQCMYKERERDTREKEREIQGERQGETGEKERERERERKIGRETGRREKCRGERERQTVEKERGGKRKKLQTQKIHGIFSCRASIRLLFIPTLSLTGKFYPHFISDWYILSLFLKVR